MSQQQAEVVVVGSVNADVSYTVPHLPLPGETVLSSARLDAPGGKGANQAVALAALGISVDFIGAVGSDENGRMLRAGLEARGVGTAAVSVVDNPTGSAVIVVSDTGENSIVVHPGANAQLDEAFVASYFADHSPTVVMAQLEVPLATVLRAFRETKGKTLLNPAPMPERTELLGALIAEADVLVPNRTELAALAGEATPLSVSQVVECAKKLSYEGQLVVTLGSDGALVFPDGVTGEWLHVAAPVVEAIDTSGAGDAFCAALAGGIHRHKSLVEAAQFAVEFAAWTVTQRGAQVPLHTHETWYVPA